MRRSSGFTLIELLIAAAVAGLLISMIVYTTISSRRVMNLDTARLSVNENLRSAFLVINNDLRQTGERLNSDFPALTINSGTTDTLTIRRNVLSDVLPVCKDIKAGSAADVVFVSRNGAGRYPDACTNATPSGLAAWEAYRKTQPGLKLSVYIYDPVTKQGEFFSCDQLDSSGQNIHRAGGSWQNDYAMNDAPNMYVLEEHTYSVANGKLWLQENGGAAQAVAPNISSLKATATVKAKDSAGNITYVTLSGSFPPSGTTYDWKDLSDVKIDLTGGGTSPLANVTRTLSERTTPRNAFSADQ